MQLLVPDRRLLTPRADVLRALKMPPASGSGPGRAAKRTASGAGLGRAVVNTCADCCGGEPGDPIGACCRSSDGFCQDGLTELACLGQGAGYTWLGENSLCSGGGCAAPPSCCTPPGQRCWNRCGSGPGAGAGAGPVTVSIVAVATMTFTCCVGSPLQKISRTYTKTISAFGSFTEFCAAGVRGVCANRPTASATRNDPHPSDFTPCTAASCPNPATCPFQMSISTGPTTGPGGVPGWNWTCRFGDIPPFFTVEFSGFIAGCAGGSGTGSFQTQQTFCANAADTYRVAVGTVDVTIVADGRYPCPGTASSLRGVSDAELDQARAVVGSLSTTSGGGCSGCGGSGGGGALI